MEIVNLYVAWVCMLAGAIFGALSGLFFHKQEWMGGYGSWQRRMMRLGHISFFGLAFVNFAFVFTVSYLGLNNHIILPSRLLVIGTLTMPLVCVLSVHRTLFRHFFFIPVLSIMAAMIIFIVRGLVT